jgi:NAD(P)-dependent dehydrogenase (short-subunit alcohol dehydrogenase family)
LRAICPLYDAAGLISAPLGRFGQPDGIARIAVFLASDDSAALTGGRLTAARRRAEVV